MLGTPTRSDAIKISKGYAEAVSKELLQGRIRTFSDIFSGVFPHNHVAEAYRDSGNEIWFPDNIEKLESSGFPKLIKGTFPICYVINSVPKGANELLKPELVYNYFFNKIKKYKTVLGEAQCLLDREIKYTCNENHNDEIYDIVECNYTEATGSLTEIWEYTYNPYKLANRIINEFYRSIIRTYGMRLGKIDDIVSIIKIAREYTESTNYRLVKGFLDTHNFSSTWSFETQDGPVNELYRENRRIGEASDISLSFDESRFIYRISRQHIMITSANIITDIGNRFHCFNLSSREALRQLIDLAIRKKGLVIINGVKYKRRDDNIVNGYIADDLSYQEIANLLGNSIEQPNGQVISPELWAIEEFELVAQYRLNLRVAKEELISIYDCDTSDGNPSKKKAFEQLDFSLQICEFNNI